MIAPRTVLWLGLAQLIVGITYHRIGGFDDAMTADLGWSRDVIFGAASGVLTIARGTLPLMLFDPRIYGAFVGKLLIASFLLSATGPVIYASVIQRAGDIGALVVSLVAAGLVLAAALRLRLRFGRRGQPA